MLHKIPPFSLLSCALALTALLVLLGGTPEARAQDTTPGSHNSQVMPGNDEGINIVGVTKHSDAELDKLAASGARWVRISFPFMMIEAQKDRFSWSVPDANVAALRARGLHILGILSGTPCWATLRPTSKVPHCNATMQIPATQAWENYISTVVSRYGKEVKYWEVWNEPDISTMLDGTLTDYREKILKPAAVAIHDASAGAKVVAPAISAERYGVQQFQSNLRAALSNGAAGMVDVVSVHVYRTPSEVLSYGWAARAVMNELNIGNKELWLTEYGNRISQIKMLLPGAEEGPRNYFLEVEKKNQKKHVYDKLFWFSLLDKSCPKTDPRYPSCNDGIFGLLDPSLAPRPAYRAFQETLH